MRIFRISLFLLAFGSIFSYPFVNPIPDTTFTEGDTVNLTFTARGWQYNSLHFSVAGAQDGAIITDLGRTGGCTCSETIWSGHMLWATDMFSAGVYEVIVTVTDTEYVSASDTFILTILNVPVPPVLSVVPDQILFEHDTLFVNLDDYIDDPDNPDCDIVWSLAASTSFTMDITPERILCVTNETGRFRADSVVLLAEDPDSETGILVVRIQPVAVNDPPVFEHSIPLVNLTSSGMAEIDLADYASDPDNPFSELTFRITGNRVISWEVTAENILLLRPITCAFGLDTMLLIVSDAEFSDTTEITVMLYPASVQENPAPQKLEMAAYPNPFNSTVKIDLPENAASVSVFDAAGHFVKKLNANSNSARWNGTDKKGNSVSAGIYFIRAESENTILSKSIVLVK